VAGSQESAAVATADGGGGSGLTLDRSTQTLSNAGGSALRKNFITKEKWIADAEFL
jgi:hypothetical protein